MSLDDRLREILADNFRNLEDGLEDEAIAQIKQAFEEEGYYPEDKSFYKKGWDAGYHTAEIEYKAVGYVGKEARLDIMTGQEWFSAYEREKGQGSLDNLKDYPRSQDYIDGIDHAVIKCDEAAKRASGLESQL